MSRKHWKSYGLKIRHYNIKILNSIDPPYILVESEKNAMRTMIVEDNNIAMSITYQLECAKTRKFPKPDPNPKIRVFWVSGRIILIPNPTRSTINIITMGSYLRWLSIYIFFTTNNSQDGLWCHWASTNSNKKLH